mmetsp:Transcript_32132/g.78042  ORF Transcript_32132/g.78042 Transcript_32132/m.78042 type:complete len:339 (+) Transcript_32132:636-1652(+)
MSAAECGRQGGTHGELPRLAALAMQAAHEAHEPIHHLASGAPVRAQWLRARRVAMRPAVVQREQRCVSARLPADGLEEKGEQRNRTKARLEGVVHSSRGGRHGGERHAEDAQREGGESLGPQMEELRQRRQPRGAHLRPHAAARAQREEQRLHPPDRELEQPRRGALVGRGKHLKLGVQLRLEQPQHVRLQVGEVRLGETVEGAQHEVRQHVRAQPARAAARRLQLAQHWQHSRGVQQREVVFAEAQQECLRHRDEAAVVAALASGEVRYLAAQRRREQREQLHQRGAHARLERGVAATAAVNEETHAVGALQSLEGTGEVQQYVLARGAQPDDSQQM